MALKLTFVKNVRMESSLIMKLRPVKLAPVLIIVSHVISIQKEIKNVTNANKDLP